MSETPDGRDWRLLTLATLLFGYGFGIQLGAGPSFAAGYLHLPREGLGLLESCREIPGLVMAGTLGLVASFALPRLAGVSLLVLGLGIGLTPLATDLAGLIVVNVVWSVGLHLWLTVQPNLTMLLAPEGRHGYSLGLMNRNSALAMMTGLLSVRLLGGWIGFTGIFTLGGAAAALGCAFALPISRKETPGASGRIVLRLAYWRYYALMLLDGGRRQLVQTFALLILVREFSQSAATVATLLLVSSGLTLAASATVGRWTDRFGERRVLSTYYALVALVFFGYTQISAVSRGWHLPAVGLFAGLFLVDNLLFTASVGIQTYIRHAAPPEELSASLAMGLTWNHIAAVTVPLLASYLWARYGYERIFLWGIVLAAASWVTCFTLPRRPATA